MGVLLQAKQAGAPLSPSIISPAKVVAHHVPLQRRNSKEKENLTSKRLFGIKYRMEERVLFVTFAHV